MPSYRYLRDIKPEDTQVKKPRQYTKKEKAANWWHYHWKWVAVGLAVVLLATFLLRDLIGTAKPDIIIGFVRTEALPDEVVQKLQEGLQALTQDTNGDGKVLVQVDVYTISPYAGEDEQGETGSGYVDPYAQMAGTTQLTAALTSDQPIIFVASGEESAYYQEMYGLFGLPTGEQAEKGSDMTQYTVAWEDCPVLAQIDLRYTAYDGTTMDGQELLQGHRVGLRPLQDPRMENKKEWAQAWQQNEAFYRQLTA